MIKRCVICGVEFDARGPAITCGAVCVKEKNNRHQRQRKQTPEYKEYMRQKRQTPEYKEYDRQRNQTPEYKEYQRQYRQTPEHKEYQRQRRQTATSRLAFFQTLGMVDAVLKAD